MSKNTSVETAKKGQATNNIQSENKKDKTPTGKIILMKETEARKKAREEQFRNFRINALRRRCKRMKYTEEQTEEFVKKLIEQMNAPNEYTIIVMLNKNDMKMMEESIKNADIKYTHRSPCDEKKPCGGYFAFQGTQETLKKIQEITPPGAKIHTYAKKMESVLPKQEKEVIKKPSNNTAEKKAAANPKRKMHQAVKSTRHFHRMQKGRYKNLRQVFLAHKRSKLKKATTVQLNAKKSSTGSKKASTNLKKAA